MTKAVTCEQLCNNTTLLRHVPHRLLIYHTQATDCCLCTNSVRRPSHKRYIDWISDSVKKHSFLLFLQIISVKKKSTHTKTIFYFVGCIISLSYSNDPMTIFIQLWNMKIYNIIEIVYKYMLENLYTGHSVTFFASLLLNVAVALIVFLFYIIILQRYVNYRHYQSLQNPIITFVPCYVIHTLDVSVLFSKNKSQKTPLSSPTGHGMGVFC